jgi:very-short-patch-repair endonuclease
MSDSRRAAQRQGGLDKKCNLITTAETLRKREDWKYVKVKNLLTFLGENFEFEYSIPPYVFDLCLLDRKLFIEFDGAYHSGKQLLIDAAKQKIAEKNGWKILRIKVSTNTIVDPEFLYKILN